MEGYLHPLYAESFSEIGTPFYLPKSKGWLIKRKIPGTEYYDAMGPYPLLFCENWEYLIEDINALKNDLVAVSFVIGPLEKLPLEHLEDNLDFFHKYRNHFLLDTAQPVEKSISAGRRKTALKALHTVDVEFEIAPDINLDEWCCLYKNLIKTHNISGIREFSRNSFSKQIAIPSTYYFRAVKGEEVVGGALFYLQNNSAYYHLAASTEKGYELHAAYAVVWSAINVLSYKIRWIELQGGTSRNSEDSDGLSEFKRGWSNFEKKSYFCGKILNPQIYDFITNNKKIQTTQWFPAYRFGEYD